MNVARPFRIIATIAALVAVAFGMGTYTHADFTTIHMLFGLIVALALLILAVIAVFSSGLRRLGAIGIVYAFIVPIFGVTQQMILAGDLHWLVETAHLGHRRALHAPKGGGSRGLYNLRIGLSNEEMAA